MKAQLHACAFPRVVVFFLIFGDIKKESKLRIALIYYNIHESFVLGLASLRMNIVSFPGATWSDACFAFSRLESRVYTLHPFASSAVAATRATTSAAHRKGLKGLGRISILLLHHGHRRLAFGVCQMRMAQSPHCRTC